MPGSGCYKASRHCVTIRQATIRELVEDSEDTYFGLGRKDAHGNALKPWHFGTKHKLTIPFHFMSRCRMGLWTSMSLPAAEQMDGLASYLADLLVPL